MLHSAAAEKRGSGIRPWHIKNSHVLDVSSNNGTLEGSPSLPGGLFLRREYSVRRLERVIGFNCVVCGVGEVLPHRDGPVEEAEVLENDGDVDGGVGVGEVILEVADEIDERGCETYLVAVEQGGLVVELECVLIEAVRFNKLGDCLVGLAGFKEADGKFGARPGKGWIHLQRRSEGIGGLLETTDAH